jgi:hypothetical protein
VPLQEPHFPNILPSQNEHLKDPFLPVPLQKEHVKLEVPEPRQVPHILGPPEGGAEVPTCPDPPQKPHLLNILPSQNEHLNPPFLPDPLQKEH